MTGHPELEQCYWFETHMVEGFIYIRGRATWVSPDDGFCRLEFPITDRDGTELGNHAEYRLPSALIPDAEYALLASVTDKI